MPLNVLLGTLAFCKTATDIFQVRKGRDIAGGICWKGRPMRVCPRVLGVAFAMFLAATFGLTGCDASESSPNTRETSAVAEDGQEKDLAEEPDDEPAETEEDIEVVDRSDDSEPETVSKESESDSESSGATMSQVNALGRARDYLATMPFSYAGLIDQLEFEEYSTEDATYAADNCGADWSEQAVEKAKDYINTMPFSYTGLIEQLEFEGFTTEQATLGADKCGADWNEQAVEKAKDYLDTMSFSHEGLVDQLVFEGFTYEQAEHGVSGAGL